MRERRRIRVAVGPILELLRQRAGLVFSPGRSGEIEATIEAEMRAAGASDPAGYLQLLSANKAALDTLIAACTVGESYFFREPEQLDFIRRKVLPELADATAGRGLRVWSAGCASGEEAYSLAILLRECGLGGRAQVVGTDITPYRLARARRAEYTAWALRGVPESQRRRYFTRRGKRYDLLPEIRSAATFRYLNLAAGGYPSSSSGICSMDLVLCRNVLIYLDRDAIADIATRLYAALAPGGWLFLAASDPSLSEFAAFETHVTDRGLAYRRPLAEAPRVDRSDLSDSSPPTEAWVSSDGESRRWGVSDTVPARPTLSKHPATPAPAARGTGKTGVKTTAAAPAAVDRELPVGRVRALADQGRLVEAGLACAAALEEHGATAELLYLHSVLLAQAGHHAEAAAAARRALYLQDDLAVAHIALGDAAGRLNDERGARRAFSSAVRLLARVPSSEIVPGSGGEPASRLLELARTKLRFLSERLDE